MRRGNIRRARIAATALAVLMVAGVAASCTPPAGGPSACNDTVSGIIGGNPLSVPTTGWFSSDTRLTGNVQLSSAYGAPSGLGCTAVLMTTGNNYPTGVTTGPFQDKAQLFSYDKVGQALSSISSISYWSYRSSASSGSQAPDIALNVQVTGASVPGNFATLVYEPYNQSGGQGAIVNDTWQQWNATASTPGDGLWWSTKGSQSNLLTWSQVQTLYAGATIGGYGFNLGSNNPNQVVAGDGLQFGGTLTNF
jgi:hypothetical protein